MTFFCMKYTWRMQIIRKANELLHAVFLQKLELLFASFISKQLGGTLGFLLHEVYLATADYWKGKLMFSCWSFCRNWSSNLQGL